jgi:hypothetical protein
VQHAFETVLWVVCALSALGALAALISGAKTWKDYGKGGLAMDADEPHGSAAGSAVAIQERDAEIRDLVIARNLRRVRRGKPPLEVEAEIEREIAGLTDL